MKKQIQEKLDQIKQLVGEIQDLIGKDQTFTTLDGPDPDDGDPIHPDPTKP